MKCMLLLFFVVACKGLAIHKMKSILPTPQLKVLTALDPPALLVEWEPVESSDLNEPVIGYKVMVWELPPVKTLKYIEVDGKKKLVEELMPPKIGDATTPPEEDAKKIVVDGAYVSEAKIPSIKLNVIYEVRVRAFSKLQDGPLSPHMRVQLMDDKEKEMDFHADNEVYHFV